MRLNSFVASLAIMLMPFAATAQTNGANQPNIPAHISETIFVQSPDDHVLGSETAVQSMIVYASVTCPHCGGWFSEEWPKVKTELIDAGIMRFVFREFPTAPSEMSVTGFMLASCAPTDQYFDIIEYQMENQQQIFKDAREGRAKEAYDKIAAKAGMTEPEAVAACLGNPDILRHIQDNVQRARLGGVEGVPAFFINGQLYQGPSDADNLIDLVKTLDKNRVTTLPTELTAPKAKQ